MVKSRDSAAHRALVGRADECSELRTALDGASGGRGTLFLVSGEAGIGKTRLALELEQQAEQRDFVVAWARSWQAGGAPAFWPWSEALSAIAGRLSPEALRSILDQQVAALAPLLPEHSAHLVPLVDSDADRARFVLFCAVRTFLDRSSRFAPVVLIFDDLHAADHSTLLLLEFLSQSIRSLPLLVFATFREVEMRLSPELGPVVGEIARSGRTLPLGRLAEADASDLVQSVASLEPEAKHRVLDMARGNPLFLGEMARLCLLDPARFKAGGAELPHGVLAVIGSRLSRLPEPVRRALEIGATIGDEFDLPLVAVVGELPATKLDQLAATGRENGILLELDGLRLRFAHGLYREALYRGLSLSNRRRLHGAIVLSLEQRHASDPDPPLAELAHHALEAEPDHLERAVGYSVRAAEVALGMLAYEDALSLLERASAVVERLPGSAALSAELLLARGLAQIRVGEIARGRELCKAAAEIARKLPAPELFARAALGYGSEIAIAVVDPSLIRLLEDALAALGDQNARLRVMVMARLAAAQQPSKNHDEPIALAREAIALARTLDHEPTLLGVLHFGMAAMMDFVVPQQRIGLNREMGTLAARLGDRPRQLRAHGRLVFDHVELGDFEAALLHTEMYERLVAELGLPHLGWRAPLFRAMHALALGRFDQAYALREQAAQSPSSDAEASRCLAEHKLGALRAAERLDELAARIDTEASLSFGGLAEASAFMSASKALLAARREDSESVERLLDEVPEDTWLWEGGPPSLMLLAEPVAHLKRDRRARALYERLLPTSGHDISWGMFGCLWEGPGDRILGLLAGAFGEWATAAEHFDAALARLERLSALPYLARTRYEFARMLVERARPGDPARASELLRSSREIALELSLPSLVELISKREALTEPALREQNRKAASDFPARRDALAADIPAFTLVREGEFWSLEWEGPTARLKDSRGQRMLALLLAVPDREVHARELAGGPTPSPEAQVDRGDAGEMLDERAVSQYRRRVADLRTELDEAEDFRDAERAERLRGELEFVTNELARAVGLGGRARRSASSSERARIAVQRRLKDAISRIEAAAPPVGRHLQATIHTGLFCAYRPTTPRRSESKRP